MHILLLNVPHPAIGSRIPWEQLPPFGRLCVGGRLIDDGRTVANHLGGLQDHDKEASRVVRAFRRAASLDAQPL